MESIINARDCELAGFDLPTVLAEAAWAVEPRDVPLELTPTYSPMRFGGVDLTPTESASMGQVLRMTEEALRVAHLMVERVDNDDV